MKKWIILLFLCAGCSENVFKEIAKPNTPEAVYYQAKLSMNDGDYDAAILLLESLSLTFLANRDVALVYASAYSGRCGLNFVNLLTQLEGVATAPTIFYLLMGSFPGGTDSKITDCIIAETTVNTFGTYTVRSTEENILMGLSSLTKVGTILNRWADADSDGVADAGFDHCDVLDFPDTAVREIGTGIANAILSISAVSSSISSDAITDITAMCALNPLLNSFCTNTDASAYTALEVKFLRSILASGDEGIGAPTCAGSFVTCPCP
jgi:hypothetical protein